MRQGTIPLLAKSCQHGAQGRSLAYQPAKIRSNWSAISVSTRVWIKLERAKHALRAISSASITPEEHNCFRPGVLRAHRHHSISRDDEHRAVLLFRAGRSGSNADDFTISMSNQVVHRFDTGPTADCERLGPTLLDANGLGALGGDAASGLDQPPARNWFITVGP